MLGNVLNALILVTMMRKIVELFGSDFINNGEVEDIIIDDYFPVLGNGRWAFVRGGEAGKELWPMILEKAYAKLNGSYNYIEAGKVQYALADMTNGVPEQIELKKIQGNIQPFWEKLKKLHKQKALMGAGSPEHEMGDSAISEHGIVQGHAYAILDMVEVDDYKLIKLRNPHGGAGAEWNGDWSDDSEMWDTRSKNKCKYVDKPDGEFWMDIDDFVENYSYIYICRMLDSWNKEQIDGEWIGESAEGLPSREYRQAKLELNPQYELKISKPGSAFIQMNQFEKVNMFKGKHFIMWLIQRTGGGLIKKMNRKAILGMSGQPINLNIVSAEVTFPKTLSYPQKVTLLAANTKHGKEGEAKFAIKIHCESKFTVKTL
jgi:hypothetical protein